MYDLINKNLPKILHKVEKADKENVLNLKGRKMSKSYFGESIKIPGVSEFKQNIIWPVTKKYFLFLYFIRAISLFLSLVLSL